MINSFYKIKIDPLLSNNSYLYNKEDNRLYLDFMSMYSSLPLGYNHDIFKRDDFKESINKWAGIRITNCEYTSEEREIFEKDFMEFTSLGIFHNPHFACTGALAVEHGIKMAFEYSNKKNPKVISHNKSFHGITSYGNIVTGRTGPSYKRLNGFPGDKVWPKFNDLDDLELSIKKDQDIAAILFEPVQCTNGDIYYSLEFFKGLRSIANKYDIPLIYDEIQTGFCTTGKIWYFQNTAYAPDIIIFGKKSQVSGAMSTKRIAEKIKDPSKYCITWDGDIIDMIRSTYIIKAIKEKDLTGNSIKQGYKLHTGLEEMGLMNVRSCGLLIAFDFGNQEQRNSFILRSKNNGLLVNSAGNTSIRIRPNLAVKDEEVKEALKIIKKSIL
jgi:L-lysine 6-transaminase